MEQSSFSLRKLGESLAEILTPKKKTNVQSNKEKEKKETVTERLDFEENIKELRTIHTKCPACGGGLSCKDRGREKKVMTLYTERGVEHVVQVETRCQEEHCG